MPRVNANDPLQGTRFRVSIPGLPNAVGFKKVSGLSKEATVVSYDEGGYKNTHKIQGKTKVGELVCEKGVFPNKDIENVFKNAITNADYRTTVTIELLNPVTEEVARTWTVTEAWCSKWELGEMDSSSEDIVVETITIQYEDFL